MTTLVFFWVMIVIVTLVGWPHYKRMLQPPPWFSPRHGFGPSHVCCAWHRAQGEALTSLNHPIQSHQLLPIFHILPFLQHLPKKMPRHWIVRLCLEARRGPPWCSKARPHSHNRPGFLFFFLFSVCFLIFSCFSVILFVFFCYCVFSRERAEKKEKRAAAL